MSLKTTQSSRSQGMRRCRFRWDRDNYDPIQMFNEDRRDEDTEGFSNPRVQRVLNAVRSWHERIYPRLARHLVTLPKGYTVCDLGCGPGHYAPFLASFGCGRYVGVDGSAHRIEYAKKMYGKANRSFVLSDISTFRSEEPFDFVWMCTVLQHMPVDMKLRAIDTIKAILKPTGVCLLYEGRIMQGKTQEECDTLYRQPEHEVHMVPVAFETVRERVAPRTFEHTPPFYEVRQGEAGV